MKKFSSILIVLFFTIKTLGQSQGFFDIADRFFKKNVTPNGLVNYAVIKANPEILNNLVFQIGETKLSDGQPSKIAFYINAYNLLVIKSVIEEYPISSPNDIAGFFTTKKHLVAGNFITLNELEKKELFGIKKDPRFHFALVCGAKGCPPILDEAYFPSTVEKQLEKVSKTAISSPQIVSINIDEKKVTVSEIFKWYKSDFLVSEPSLKSYIQSYEEEDISDFTLVFSTYDWSLNDVLSSQVTEDSKSNIATFTPAVLLRKGQFELNIFNNLYTQNSVRTADGETIELSQRQSFLTSIWQFTFGVTKSAKINAGFDVNFNRSRYGDASLSPFSIFGNDKEPTSSTRNTVASIGPRIKWAPLASVPRLSVQSTFLFPVADSLESPRFTAHDRYTWFTQFFFDKWIGTDFQIFLETDLLYRFKRYDTQKDFFRIPVGGFLSYFPSSKMTVYVQTQYSPRFDFLSDESSQNLDLTGWFIQAGGGMKYQITSRFNIELSYTNFVASRSAGAGSTYNVGLRYIR